MSAIRCPFVASVVVVAMLTACGDEVTEVTNVNASLDIVEKYKELPKCEESVYGSLKYVEDSSQVFACTSDGWVSLKGEKGAKGDEGKAGENGKNGESCTTAALGDGSGYEVKCNGKLVGTITNGKDGESCTTKAVEGGVEVSCPGSEPVVIKNGDKGADGKSAYELSGTDKTLEEWLASLKGKNGESCTTAALGDGSGYEVKCNGKLVGTITNGKNGESCTTKAVEGGGVEVSCPGSEPVVIKNGTNGENGTGCNVVSDKDGVVTIQCGEGENAKTTELYKAVCGTKPFDPKHQFCFDNVVYNQCGDKVYDPSKEFCSNEVVYKAVCGTKPKPFDPKHQFCFDNGVYNQCGDKVYDPFKEFCSNEVVYDLCGGKAYDPELQSCTKVQFADNTEQYYKTVTIAPKGVIYSKTWMAENLNYKTANSWCYDDKDENCAKYGRLYTWAAAVGKTETECGYGQECNLGTGDIRGVCPEGWHLPSKEEWEDLIKAVGGQSTSGAKLKSKTGWEGYSGINNEDAFGFSALPAGLRDLLGGYDREGDYAYFWSSSEYNGLTAYLMLLSYDNENADLNYNIKYDGFSVRCLKD